MKNIVMASMNKLERPMCSIDPEMIFELRLHLNAQFLKANRENQEVRLSRRNYVSKVLAR